MSDTITIQGVEYELFSIERGDMGGRYSKKETIALLKSKGIKVSTNKNYCYTPYVGHYALLIEKARSKEAEDLLF